MDDARSLSRREAFQLFGAAGAFLAGGTLIGACAPTAPSTGGQTGGSTTPSAPRVGGELRMDILSEPQSVDPLRFNGSDALRAYRLSTNRLLQWDTNRKYAPDLASAMPTVSADGLTYTFKLKTGVKWHDGKTFDSADVKFTYETIAKPEVPGIWKPAVAFISNIETPDAQTVVFTLRSKFTFQLAKFALVPIISSKVPYVPNETYARTIIGTGPYKLMEWQQGTQMVFERFPEYFESGKPYIQKITQRVVTEDAARVTNLRTNASQMTYDPPANTHTTIRGFGAQLDIAENSTFRNVLYPALRADSPTRDVNLRKAIMYAIDRQQIIDQVYAGAAAPASTYLSAGSDYFDPKLGTFYGNKPDMAKVREFLQKAGGAPARELLLVTSNTPTPRDIGTIIQANLKSAGINCRLSPEDTAPYTDKILNNRDYDLLLVIAGTGPSSGFAPDYVWNGMLSTSPNSFNRGGDAEFDALLMKAIAADERDMPAAWKAIQEADLEKLYQLQIVTSKYSEAYTKRLKGYTISDLGSPYFLKDAWLDA